MNVLIAVDDSPESQHAVDAAFAFFGAEPNYSVITVADQQPVMLGAWGAGSFVSASSFRADIDAAARDVAETTARENAERLPTDAKVETAEGHTGMGICDAAVAQSSDVIVIGSHDRNFWERLIDPSVGRYLVEHAPCPVLVIR